jgi:hypothetical protein
MSVHSSQIGSTAKALADTLAKLSQAERDREPSPQFIERYNQLLDLAREAIPTVDNRLWPPRAEVGTRYVELQTYSLQVYRLVPLPAPTIVRG